MPQPIVAGTYISSATTGINLATVQRPVLQSETEDSPYPVSYRLKGTEGRGGRSASAMAVVSRWSVSQTSRPPRAALRRRESTAKALIHHISDALYVSQMLLCDRARRDGAARGCHTRRARAQGIGERRAAATQSVRVSGAGDGWRHMRRYH